MSYEGYEVYVCPEGHQWSRGVYDEGGECCPHCSKPPAWTCSVDETNGEYEEPPLEVAEEAPRCKCCGQATGPVRYVVPGPDIKAVYVGGGHNGG